MLYTINITDEDIEVSEAMRAIRRNSHAYCPFILAVRRTIKLRVFTGDEWIYRMSTYPSEYTDNLVIGWVKGRDLHRWYDQDLPRTVEIDLELDNPVDYHVDPRGPYAAITR